MFEFALCPNSDRLSSLRGHYSFEENGRPLGLYSAFSENTLVGVRLSLPRMLATDSATLILEREEGERFFFPFRLLSSGGAEEHYALMLTRSMLNGGGVFHMSILLEGVFGRLAAYRAKGGAFSFTRDLLAEGGFPPLSLGEGTPHKTENGQSLLGAVCDYLVSGEGTSLLQYVTGEIFTLGWNGTASPRAFLEEDVPFAERLARCGVGAEQREAYERIGILLSATLLGAPTWGACADLKAEAYRRHVAEICTKESAFSSGRLALLLLEREALVFARVREGEALVTIVNRSQSPLRISSQDGFSVLLGGRGLKNEYALAACSAVLLRAPVWQDSSAVLHIEKERPSVKCRKNPPIRRPRAELENKIPPTVRETVIRSVIDF